MRGPSIAFVLVASGVAAQSTHLVGPGGLPQIRDALAIAAAGDTILVQPGTYAQFDVKVGVTIRTQWPGAVTIAYDWNYAPAGCGQVPACIAAEGATRFQVPAGQTAHVVGLRFDGTISQLVMPRVEVLGGRVTFDQCDFGSWALQALKIDQAVVHLQYCTATGANGFNPVSRGMTATGSTVTVVGGTFFGAASASATNVGADGISLNGCVFHGSGLVAVGGASTLQGGRGVHAIGGSTWISDAVVQSGGSSCGLSLSGSQSHVARTGFNNGPCPGNDRVLGVLRPGPMQIGSPFAIDFRTAPHTVVGVVASMQLDTNAIPWLTPAPHLWMPGLLDGGIFLTSGTGVAIAPYTIPFLPHLIGQPLWFQGVTGLTFPLLTSPVAGGIVR